ncbi:MAG: hypothetical protein PHN44_04015 [Candidatus Marinimicrobia bacterium]|nr:hypothetical protein [Candidatus Neomarinimicrobiota bacterium]
MSNLLTTEEGRNALLVAQRYQLERRLSRFFHRTIVIDFSDYKQGLSEFDLSKMLGQLNSAHDQEIIDIFRLLGAIGGLQTSVADTTYYVNAATGNDQTGTGSSALPFASLWFLENLPRRLNHRYRVVLQSDISEPTKSLHFNFSFGNDGSFALLGAGTPTVIESNTVGAIGTLTGGGGLWCACVAGLGPNAQSSFLRGNNYAVPIHKVIGANCLFQSMPFTFGGVGPGAAVQVVRPARTLTIQNIVSECSGGRRGKQSQIGIFNLNVDFPDSPPPFFNFIEAMIKWRNTCDSTLSFVRFTERWNGSGTNYAGNEFRYGSLNKNVHVDQQEILNLSQCGLLNLDGPNTTTAPYVPQICGAKFGDISAWGPAECTMVRDCEIMAVDFDNLINIRGAVKVEYSNARNFICRNASFDVQYCMMDGMVTVVGMKTRAGIEGYCSIINTERCTTLVSDNCISCFGGCIVKIGQCGSDGTYSVIGNSGVWNEGTNWYNAFYNFPGSTPVSENMVGTVANLIDYSATAGEIGAAWPALDIPQSFVGGGTVIVSR